MIVEKLYISILNFIYKHTSGLSQRTRSILMYSCLTIIIVSTYFYQAKRFFLYDYPAMLNSFIGTCAFIGFLIVSIDRKIEMVKIRSWLMYVLMLCGIVIVVSGIHHYIGYSYILMGLFMTFLMPPFIIVWCYRRDFDTLFRCIAIIGVLCFICYYFVNMICAPAGMDDTFWGRYGGIAADPNGVAKSAVASCVCGIYLLITWTGRKKIWMIPIISASIGMTLMTVSRANLIALGCILIWGMICGIKYCYHHRDRILIKRIVLYALFLVVLIPVFINGLQLKNVLEKETIKTVSETQVVTSVDSTEPSSSSVGVDKVIEQRMQQGKTGDNGIDLNTASSGRIALWWTCLQKSSLIGNDIGNGAIIVPDAGRPYYHTHNTVLELLLRSGVFASGLFFVLELYCAYWILRCVFSRRINTSYELFAVMAITAFGIASLFDIVVLPFAKQTVAMFYLSLPCVMCLKDSVKVENK